MPGAAVLTVLARGDVAANWEPKSVAVVRGVAKPFVRGTIASEGRRSEASA